MPSRILPESVGDGGSGACAWDSGFAVVVSFAWTPGLPYLLMSFVNPTTEVTYLDLGSESTLPGDLFRGLAAFGTEEEISSVTIIGKITLMTLPS